MVAVFNSSIEGNLHCKAVHSPSVAKMRHPPDNQGRGRRLFAHRFGRNRAWQLQTHAYGYHGPTLAFTSRRHGNG